MLISVNYNGSVGVGLVSVSILNCRFGFVLVELAWDNVIKGVFEAWTFGLADMSTPKSEVKCPFLWAFLFGSFLLGI